MKNQLKQWERDLKTLEKLNEKFFVSIKVRAAYAPFPVIDCPISELSERMAQFEVMRRPEDKDGH
jgi:hypothetical protein